MTADAIRETLIAKQQAEIELLRLLANQMCNLMLEIYLHHDDWLEDDIRGSIAYVKQAIGAQNDDAK